MVELVPAVCPKCGANLEVPEDLKIAHCIYCGAKVIIEESKPDVHFHGIGTVENYLKLAEREYLKLRRGEETHITYIKKLEEYCDKILEIDADNTRGMVLRLYVDAFYCLGVEWHCLDEYAPFRLKTRFWDSEISKPMKDIFSKLLTIYEKILLITPDENFIKEKKKNVEDIIKKIDNARPSFFGGLIQNPLFISKNHIKPINLFIPID